MKKLVAILVFALFAVRLQAQVLDTANVVVMYSIKYVKDAEAPTLIRPDEMFLLIGKKVTSFFSYTCFRADSLRKVNPEEYAHQVVEIEGRQTVVPARTRTPRTLNK